MKKIVSFILVCCMVVAMLPLTVFAASTVASGTCGDNLTWTLYAGGELVIDGTGAMTNWVGNNMPWYSCRTQIKTVTIGKSVTTIGNYAFAYCTSLTSVDIPDSVTIIGGCVFYNCTSLTGVDIPDSVTTIGKEAFRNCTSLTSVDIPDSVTIIGNYAFYNCTSLTSVDISDSVTTIDYYAFAYCTNLTSVDIPDSVTTIGNYAFYNCTGLTSVDISDSVTIIGNYAFEHCRSLTSVDIPDSVTIIDYYAFAYCTNLTSVDIPDSVTSIDNYAFAYCTSLTSVNIGDSVTTIGYYAFYNCTSLTSVDIGDSVTTIGNYAFYNCTSLTSVDIGDSVTTIDREAFCNCTSLTSVDIPDSVTSIGNYAFRDCDILTNATVYSSDVTLGTKVFVGTPDTFELHGYTGSTAETYANENGHTFVALDAEPEKFDLSGVTMTLGSSLSLDFAIDTSKLTGTDNYAEFTIVYADGRPSETVTVPQSEWTQYSGTIYTAKFTGMAAKQMNDVVTAVFYNANGQVLTNAKSDSIETYAVRMLNGSAASNKKLRTVYVDMLNYGAAAQEQFDYDEANLANRNLTDTHKAWVTASVTTADNRVKGTGYVGSTLTLSGEIQLDLVFNNSAVGKDYSSLYAIATYTDHYGNAKEVRIEGSDFIKYSSSLCQVSITGMAVADFRSVVSCTVYNASGTAVANASDSVESYANRNAASLGAMVDTIVKFAESSYNYFH